MSETAIAEPVQTQATINAQAAREADKAAREAAVKKADSFFKADIKEAPKGNPSDLFKKMAEKLNQDTTQFQDRIDAEKDSLKVAENNRPELETKASLIDDEKKPGFIKSLKQTNEQLAKEAAELKARVEKIPEYEKEIEELRSKMDDGGTKKEMEKIRQELEQAVKERQEREEALMADIENLRQANALLNLPADPNFKRDYDAPILSGYNQVKMLVGGDQSTLTEFSKAVAAYEQSLTSQDQNERMRQSEISKQTLNSIYENLSPMEQAKFQSTAYDVLAKIEARNEALINWQTTKAQIDEEKNRRASMTKTQIGKRWQDAFAQAKQQLDDAIKYPEEVSKIIASQKIDDDTSEDELIAEAALRENSNFTPEQITRVLQQGAKFKKSRAYTFALEKQVSELNETIKKMRGSGTSEGSIGSSSSGRATESEERTPAALFAKFRNR
jgi:hypothetical protein